MGVDEVGRGCIAGPVVAAAVQFPFDYHKPIDSYPEPLLHINDSKRLQPSSRLKLAQWIWQNAHVQVGWSSIEEIDRLNILQASMLAMRRALYPFLGLKTVVLVDGIFHPFEKKFFSHGSVTHSFELVPIIKGDQKSVSIAAASIVAKVFRDQWMEEFDQFLPDYGFKKHKGYSTSHHKTQLKKFGASVLHRKSFEPVEHALCIL